MTTTEDTPTTETDSSAPSVAETVALPPVVIDWQSLPKSICQGLVIAQSQVTTVENDGEVKAEKRSFKFPTTAAIACCAREALSAGELALVSIGWAASPGNGNGIRSGWLLVHSDGSVSPTITLSMPMAGGNDQIKALGATMSYTRKYLLASLLNMGWNDPREEVETMGQGRGKSGHQGHSHPKQQQPQSAWHDAQSRKQQQPQGSWDDASPRSETAAAPSQKPEVLSRQPSAEERDAAKIAWLGLRDDFNVPPPSIHKLATGLEEEPEGFSRAEVLAITQARDVYRHAEDAEVALPPGHTPMVSYLVDKMGGVPVYISGKITAAGESANRVELGPAPNPESGS